MKLTYELGGQFDARDVPLMRKAVDAFNAIGPDQGGVLITAARPGFVTVLIEAVFESMPYKQLDDIDAAVRAIGRFATHPAVVKTKTDTGDYGEIFVGPGDNLESAVTLRRILGDVWCLNPKDRSSLATILQLPESFASEEAFLAWLDRPNQSRQGRTPREAMIDGEIDMAHYLNSGEPS